MKQANHSKQNAGHQQHNDGERTQHIFRSNKNKITKTIQLKTVLNEEKKRGQITNQQNEKERSKQIEG